MARIVSIHSFRGGTGKSNITANLAAMTALSGKRVGVIDTDIQSPGIHVLFGLEKETMARSLNDYLWGRCAIDEVAYEVGGRVGADQLQASGGALFLIPSSIKAGEIARILREGYDVHRLNEGFRDLIRSLDLDFLFIDTHPGLNEETLLSIAISETLLVILRPDQQDYQGTGVTLQVARKLRVRRLHLIVNKVLLSFDFAEVKAQVESTYSCPAAAVLPQSDELQRLGSSDLFCILHPDHPFSKALRAVVDGVILAPRP